MRTVCRFADGGDMSPPYTAIEWTLFIIIPKKGAQYKRSFRHFSATLPQIPHFPLISQDIVDGK